MTDPLPMGCRARYDEIHQRSDRLLETFINGNRKDLLEELVETEPKAALAILALIMDSTRSDVRGDLTRFLAESA